jgi:hypothetical protein
MIINFKLNPAQRNVGFGQLNYKAGSLNYCLQHDGFEVIRLMRCSLDYEPQNEVTSLRADRSEHRLGFRFEKPTIEETDSDYTIELKRRCLKWIEANSD